ELGSLLGCLNPGNARGCEDIAFGDLIFCDQFERFPLQPNVAACDCSSFTERFPRNIDHFGATVARDVSEILHFVSQSSQSAAEPRNLAASPRPIQWRVFTSLDMTQTLPRQSQSFCGW